jgi:hypothetical protein
LTGYAPGLCAHYDTTYTTMPTEYNSTKWGKVAILDGANYPEFRDTCSATLAVVDAWSIVEGTELESPLQPKAVHQEWKERNQKAIQIISGSVQPRFLSSITEHTRVKDVRAMWTELAKFNRSNDPVFNSSLRDHFIKEQFDPKKEAVRDFSTRLYSYKTQLEGSRFSLREVDVTQKLLAA